MHAWPSFFHLAPPKFPSPIPTQGEHRASLSNAEEAAFTTKSDALYAALLAALIDHCTEHESPIGVWIDAAQKLVDNCRAEFLRDAADA